MTTLTIQDVSRRSGLSEPTLRYYEDVGLIRAIPRDERSGHRRYAESDLDDLQVLACLRAMGVGIEDMRTYQANRVIGNAAADEQRDILLRHADRVEQQIVTLQVHLDYLRAKAALWDARANHDPVAEEAAQTAVAAILPHLEETIR
ncbi:MerR family transcriptional regulator [Curtobacterium ammoniigenes]|uniref:MerR family transcriptional regulator n=1 Tax=Curtobacterium ammoniigenes TaxID=395387 RepID=UPI00082AE508|nr:MerR family transcriptional regulator [Curtobacterium ammoniigenes]